jgi:hypothetical protein
MHLIGLLCWILAAWKWGDWRNWNKYHSTILYFISCNFLLNYLTYNYSLWTLSDFFLPTHTLNDLAVTLIAFPCASLIFLGRYPEHSIIAKLNHNLLWIFIFSAIEYLYFLIGNFHYEHGWNIWWSILFNIMTFPMLRLHYKRPLLAYLLSVVTVVALMHIFKVPIMK